MKHLLVIGLLSSVLAIAGCKSKSDGGEESKGSERASKLEMTSDTEACVKAMKCCEAAVKLTKDAPTPSDLQPLVLGRRDGGDRRALRRIRQGLRRSIHEQERRSSGCLQVASLIDGARSCHACTEDRALNGDEHLHFWISENRRTGVRAAWAVGSDH